MLADADFKVKSETGERIPASLVPGKLSWREVILTALVLLIPLLILFWKAVFLGQALLPADLIYSLDPVWRDSAPIGFSHPGNPLLSDQVYQGYPWRAYVYYWLSHGELPLWNFSQLGGTSLIGNAQSAMFFPINIITYLLPLALSFTFLAICRLLIAGLSTYLYLRVIGRSMGAAYLGAIAFSLCGFLVVWTGYSVINVAIWLPAILLLLELIFQSRRLMWISLLALAIGIQFLGGHPETSFHILLACGIYALFLAARKWQQGSINIALCGLVSSALGAFLGFMVGAVQLLPFFEQLSKSAVSNDRASLVHLSPLLFYPSFWQDLITLPTVLVPNVLGNPTDQEYWAFTTNYNEYTAYLGTIPLLLAIVGATRFRQNSRTAFWLVMAALSFAIIYRLPFFEAINHLPLFDVTQNGRLRLIFTFAAVVLGAEGMDQLVGYLTKRPVFGSKIPGRLIWLSVITALLVLAASLGTYLVLSQFREQFLDFGHRYVEANMYGHQGFPYSLDYYLTKVDNYYDSTLRRFAFPNWQTQFPAYSGLFLAGSIGLALKGKLSYRLVSLMLPVATAIELLVFGMGYNPTVSPDQVFPNTPVIDYLSEHAGTERIVGLGYDLVPNSAMIWGFLDIRGYENVRENRNWSLLNQIGGRQNFGEYLILDSANSPLLNLLGVRYLISSPSSELASRPGLEDVFERGNVAIYKNEKALPRAWIVSKASILTDPKEVLARIQNNSFDPRTEVLLETGQNPPDMSLNVTPSQALITSYRPDSLSIDASLNGDGYLVLSDSYDDGWTALVDGNPATIYRADYAFRALHLSQGSHKIEFIYQPKGFVFGVLFTILSLAIISFLGLSSKVRLLLRRGTRNY